MFYSLLGVLLIFCGVVGYGFSTTQANVWSLLCCCLAAVTVLQVSYLAGHVIRAIGG
jgi:hypothetical protein